MKIGAKFWQLIGVVLFILIGYALNELSDSIEANREHLRDRILLLAKQETLLRNNHWIENLHAVEAVREAWLGSLPTENSATFVKARLLSDVRDIAKDAGLNSVRVSATDSEGGDKPSGNTNSNSSDNQPSAYQGNRQKKGDALPSGVQMIKLNITGRFDPVAFNKLLLILKDKEQFAVIERIAVRGTQLELGLRCYWRLSTVLIPTSASPTAEKGISARSL